MQDVKLAVLALLVHEASILMVSIDSQKLLHHIHQRQKAYLNGWEQLYAQFNSVSQDPKMSRTQEVLMTQLQCRGFTLYGRDQLLMYGELSTRARPTLLFYNHFPRHYSSQWEILPIVARLTALDVYQEIYGTLPINIKWLLHGIGETGDLHPYSIVEKHGLQADGCLWDGNGVVRETGLTDMTETGIPLLIPGTKGRLVVELKVETAECEIDTMHGAIVPDAAWRLLWALNSLKDAREEIHIEGFYDTLAYAEDQAIEQFYTMPDTAQALAQQWGMKQLLLGVQGFQMQYAHFLTPTCTITSMTSGNERAIAPETQIKTMIPAQAKAQVDFHLVPDQDPEDIFTKLQRHLQAQGFPDIQARLLYSDPPIYTPLNDPFMQKVLRATHAAYSREPRILPLTAGNYQLYPLRAIVGAPIVITGADLPLLSTHRPLDDTSSQYFIDSLKQTALIIEELGRA